MESENRKSKIGKIDMEKIGIENRKIAHVFDQLLDQPLTQLLTQLASESQTRSPPGAD